MPHRQTGLALHGARVALTPARALTSHLRRRYEERYRHRYQRSALIFGFDLFLLGACAAFVVVNVWLSMAVPQKAPGIDVAFFAPPLKTVTPIAFEAQLVVKDGKTHEHVSLMWDLPEHTEILSSSPALNSQREMMIGRLEPQVTTTVRIAVRLFTSASAARVGIRLQDDAVRFMGSETRPIVGSGISIEPLVTADAYVAGARVPFLLKNNTTAPISDVRVVGGEVYGSISSIQGVPFVLQPTQQSLVLLNPEDTQTVQVFARDARLISAQINLTSTTTNEHHQITLPVTTPGRSAAIESVLESSIQLLVLHPALKGTRTVDIPAGTMALPLPLDPMYREVVDTWFAFPVQERFSGKHILHPVLTSRGTTAFDAMASARYFTSEGDQLGIGPLPPIVGQTTKYWIHWQISPVQRDLSRVRLQAALPSGVSFTGRAALPDGGELRQVGTSVEWNLPFLPAGTPTVSASFEVAFTPTKEMRGKMVPLVQQGEAQALEDRTETRLRSMLPLLDTRLEGDVRAAGLGTVK